MIRMDRLIKVFADTQDFYTNDPVLKEAVDFGKKHTTLYGVYDYPKIPDTPKKLSLTLTLNLKSFQAAIKFNKVIPDKKIAVLNFASPIRPGGGVFSGSMAQEESLCRCSTLYPLLDQELLRDMYYTPNQKNYNFRHTDACIYSEGVVICKSDTDFPERLKQEDFITVDVIICAAPDLRKIKAMDYHEEELFDIHLKRAKHILHVAASHGIDILVTGAFGCGAFKNNPDSVAEAWSGALEGYRRLFDYIIFAVYFREHEIANFKAFNERFAVN